MLDCCSSSPSRPALYVGGQVYRRSGFPASHPLAIPRAAAVEEMCRALGWLDGAFLESPVATRAQLLRFHDAAYVDALERADREGLATLEDRERFALGTMSNPVFSGVFTRASTSVGGSILAAQCAMERRVVFHPAGGTHHGQKARASGFCYFNDPVFAILEMLALGARRVAYVDFDAHHGDGVEDAFADDPRVFTISVHEAGRWPHTGALDERRAGQARNLPVPQGLNDDEFALLVDEAAAPLIRRFQPDGIVCVVGADALRGDPLAKLNLSNGALQRAALRVAALAPAVVMLGGGGYNPWTLVRGWSGLWGRLAGFMTPDPLPAAAKAVLAGFTCDLVDDDDIDPTWLTSLDDPPFGGPVRDEIREIVAAALAP